MATRRFCDVCDRLITDVDDTPYIRCSPDKDIQISLIVTNAAGGVVNDLCNPCKVDIVINGRLPSEPRKVVEIAAAPTATHPSMSTRTGAGGGSRPLHNYEPSLKPEPEKASTESSQPQPQQPEPEGT